MTDKERFEKIIPRIIILSMVYKNRIINEFYPENRCINCCSEKNNIIGSHTISKAWIDKSKKNKKIYNLDLKNKNINVRKFSNQKDDGSITDNEIFKSFQEKNEKKFLSFFGNEYYNIKYFRKASIFSLFYCLCSKCDNKLYEEIDENKNIKDYNHIIILERIENYYTYKNNSIISYINENNSMEEIKEIENILNACKKNKYKTRDEFEILLLNKIKKIKIEIEEINASNYEIKEHSLSIYINRIFKDLNIKNISYDYIVKSIFKILDFYEKRGIPKYFFEEYIRILKNNLELLNGNSSNKKYDKIEYKKTKNRISMVIKQEIDIDIFGFMRFNTDKFDLLFSYFEIDVSLLESEYIDIFIHPNGGVVFYFISNKDKEIFDNFLNKVSGQKIELKYLIYLFSSDSIDGELYCYNENDICKIGKIEEEIKKIKDKINSVENIEENIPLFLKICNE